MYAFCVIENLENVEESKNMDIHFIVQQILMIKAKP